MYMKQIYIILYIGTVLVTKNCYYRILYIEHIYVDFLEEKNVCMFIHTYVLHVIINL